MLRGGKVGVGARVLAAASCWLFFNVTSAFVVVVLFGARETTNGYFELGVRVSIHSYFPSLSL